MGFKKAKREQVWLKVLLNGPSGCGKSYSALMLAEGIAKACGSDVAYIGTEGSRNKYYADEFSYDLLEIEEPFECEKYMNAIDEAIKAGYKVLIIDSMSHEWKWLNEFHDKMPGNSFQNWGKLKPRHHKFMEKVLYSPIHIIATARGKDEWVLEEKDGKKVPKKVGMGQQQDKDISYEFTVSLTLAQDTHIASADKDNTHLFDNKYDVLTREDGIKLYGWANKGDAPAPKPETPKYESVTEDPEETLKNIKKEIITLCSSLGGTKNTDVMSTLKSYVSSGNPNAIRDIENANKLLTDLKGVKPQES